MSLIEVNIPETDDWEDSLAARIIFTLVGLLLMRMGFRTWATMMPDYWPAAVVTILLFGLGSQLLVFAATSPEHFDLEVWGPRIAYALIIVLALTGLVTLHRSWIPKIGTDALLFSRASVEGLFAGQNPYEMSMLNAVNGTMGPSYATPRIDGGIVHQLSYPAGAVWWFVPQFATIGPSAYGLRLTLYLLALASSVVVIDALPPKLALAGIAIFLGARNLFAAAAGGIIWPIWVFPLLLGLRAWAGKRWLRSAFWVGISAGSKQFAWFILPFLAIWQWHITDGWREFLPRAVKLNAVGGAAFLALNAPFMVWNFNAWMDGVLTPVSTKAPMVHQGVGFASLSFVGAVPLPSWWYSGVFVLATLTYAAAYYLYFDALRWTAWCIPPVLLLFNTRSLMSYFTTWAPLALVAGVAAWDRLHRGSTPIDTSIPDRTGVAADD